MSDGYKTQITASSAVEAINEARWKCREVTVAEIHSGLTQKEADTINQTLPSTRAMPGLIRYEIPEHEAIPGTAEKPKNAVRKTDDTEAMFNEDEIKRESIRAMEAAARGPHGGR